MGNGALATALLAGALRAPSSGGRCYATQVIGVRERLADRS
jgi:hypothetical protein